MHVFLKVKIKSLSEEARIIRGLEKKTATNYRQRKRLKRDLSIGEARTSSGERAETFTPEQLKRIEKKLAHAQAQLLNQRASSAFVGLRSHRTNEVRKEARSSFIAYGFLRGVPYSSIEQTDKPVDWDRVEALVKKYGEDDIRIRLQRFAEWKDAK